MVESDADAGHKIAHRRRGHLGLRLAHVFASEEELTIQIAHVDRIQIDLKWENLKSILLKNKKIKHNEKDIAP